MFRKPKRKKAAGLRKKRPITDDDEEDDQEATREALKRAKQEHGGGQKSSSSFVDDEGDDTKTKNSSSVMHSFEDSGTSLVSQKELATKTEEYHPKSMESVSKSKADPKRNKFLAGPIRAPINIRRTCRFDYQPDICKDYKDTGFCGFGDTCIYLHDRGDTMAGWQLEKVWEEKQKAKKKLQEEQMERFIKGMEGGDDGNSEPTTNKESLASADDGLPFACFLTRKAFEDPIVTTCGHYFSQGALQDYFRLENDQRCPICKRDTHGVMNQPTKLLAKKRKGLGRKATWQEFMDSRGGQQQKGDGDDDDNDNV